MSVMMLDTRLYEDVAAKLKTYQWHRQVDINYCNSGCMSDEDANEFVKRLCILNELSYCARYKHQDGVSFDKLHEFINERTYGDIIDSYQMLKYLQCIHYQIELDTIMLSKYNLPDGYKDDMDNLQNIINEISNAIINEVPQYKEAKWGY